MIHAALGEELDNGAWAVRLYYKLSYSLDLGRRMLMALRVFCLFDPRYRQRTRPAPRCKMRRRLYEAQRTVNPFIFMIAAALWQLARNAQETTPFLIWSRR